ncbi:MAG: hypothetical protein HYZ53_12895 [Planctomycetes bacterium]|nr:hypothetical protein [Planctomycetota bacterium]
MTQAFQALPETPAESYTAESLPEPEGGTCERWVYWSGPGDFLYCGLSHWEIFWWDSNLQRLVGGHYSGAGWQYASRFFGEVDLSGLPDVIGLDLVFQESGRIHMAWWSPNQSAELAAIDFTLSTAPLATGTPYDWYKGKWNFGGVAAAWVQPRAPDSGAAPELFQRGLATGQFVAPGAAPGRVGFQLRALDAGLGLLRIGAPSMNSNVLGQWGSLRTNSTGSGQIALRFLAKVGFLFPGAALATPGIRVVSWTAKRAGQQVADGVTKDIEVGLREAAGSAVDVHVTAQSDNGVYAWKLTAGDPTGVQLVNATTLTCTFHATKVGKYAFEVWNNNVPEGAENVDNVTLDVVVPEVRMDGPRTVGVGRQEQWTATLARPRGGTYEWRTDSARISLTNEQTKDVTVRGVDPSAAKEDVVLKLKYVVQGDEANAESKLTVVKTDIEGHLPGTLASP